MPVERYRTCPTARSDPAAATSNGPADDPSGTSDVDPARLASTCPLSGVEAGPVGVGAGRSGVCAEFGVGLRNDGGLKPASISIDLSFRRHARIKDRLHEQYEWHRRITTQREPTRAGSCTLIAPDHKYELDHRERGPERRVHR